jgi:hypothetical protein
VAQVRVSVQEFINWYKKSKKGPRLLDMALDGGPKNAGKKPSRRKRTNKQKPAVTTVTDLLPEMGPAPIPVGPPTTVSVQPVSESPVFPRSSPSFHRSSPTLILPQRIPAAVPFTPPSTANVQSVSELSVFPRRSASFHPGNSTLLLPQSLSATVPVFPSTFNNVQPVSESPAFPSRSASFHPRNSNPILVHNNPPNVMASYSTQQQTHIACPPFRPQTSQQPGGCMQLPHSAQTNYFTLKWLTGTRVSRCYREIKNPPESVPDDLVVVYRDVRQYRSRNTGQLQYTQEPQHVHFHLRASCIRTRCRNFPSASALVVPNNFRPHFRLEHIQRLKMEFPGCID